MTIPEPTAPAAPLLGEEEMETLLDRFADLLWLQDVGTKGKARTLAIELYQAIIEPAFAALVAEQRKAEREQAELEVEREVRTRLLDRIEATMDDAANSRFDDDEDEYECYARYVEWLASETRGESS